MRRIVPLVSMRHIVLVLAAMMALALVLVSGVALKPADAASTRVVTKTFSNVQQITIPDSGAAVPYPSEKIVQGFNRGRILDVDLTLNNYSHTFPDDVDVLLSKMNSGVNRTVMSDVGGGIGGPDPTDVNNITLQLNDEASNFLPDNGPLVSGPFKPNNVTENFNPDNFPQPAPTPSSAMALSGFDGLNPNGIWKLRVVDDEGGDSGQFAGGWSIKIRARVSN